MAATGTADPTRVRAPVAVALRVLGVSRQRYYKWLADPVSQRDWDDGHLLHLIRAVNAGDPTLGYRIVTDEHDEERGIRVGENRVRVDEDWITCSV